MPTSSVSTPTPTTKRSRIVSTKSPGQAMREASLGPQRCPRCLEAPASRSRSRGTHKLLNEVFRTTPPVDLRRTNGEKLKAMDVHPEVAEAFLNNSVYSPRYQTQLVGALEEVKGAGHPRHICQARCFNGKQGRGVFS